MKNFSLILSDLDGTLFRNDKSISDYSKNVIAAAQKNGLLFGICTARAFVNASKFLDGLTPDVFVTNGGGMVICGNGNNAKKIYTCEFSVEEVRTLIKTTFKVLGNDVTISVDNEFGLYSNSKEELGDTFWTFNDFSDFREPAMKICIKSQDVQKIEEIASSVGLDKIDYLPFSDIPWYKLSKKGATKEIAIQALCDYLKIDKSAVIAFGDDFNDIGMLKLCGKGIAMQNAIEQVKLIADEVCLSNQDDGVAKWIEQWDL